jgi:hypothetical protein
MDTAAYQFNGGWTSTMVRYGIPDKAQRTALIAALIERTLKVPDYAAPPARLAANSESIGKTSCDRWMQDPTPCVCS